MPDWQAINRNLRQHGVAIDESVQAQSVSGGDINAAWRLRTSAGAVFIKTAAAESFDMFSAEADGLNELANAKAIRVPQVMACDTVGAEAYIALEWLEFSRANSATDEKLGHRLAALHRTHAERYGWHRDNTIGLTPQPNAWNDDWVEFFRTQRLIHQLRLAEANGYGGELQQDGMRLAENLERLFAGYQPQSSLLHGDLWGGNWASVNSEPVIFDPAVYFGDRESDLAMTRLFGGFSGRFYDAYNESWPLEDGHIERCSLYQLYHVLNHLNLFGSGYLGRSMQLIRALL